MSTSADDILDAGCLECKEAVEMVPFDYSHAPGSGRHYRIIATLGARYFGGVYDDPRVAAAVFQAIEELGAEASIDFPERRGAEGAVGPRPTTAVSQATGDEVL